MEIMHTSRYPVFSHGHTRHGLISREYRSWSSMKERCNNPNSISWKYYGARGITVCERWFKFENFLADMGPRPQGTTLDRFPNKDGNYEPGNCRWATATEQRANRRPNLKFSQNHLARLGWLVTNMLAGTDTDAANRTRRC